MEYIAHKHFTVIPQGTNKIINYVPGDVVDGFDTWSERTKRTHLDTGLVQKHADTAEIDRLIQRRCLPLEQRIRELETELASRPPAPMVARPAVRRRVAEPCSPFTKEVTVVEMLDDQDPGGDKAAVEQASSEVFACEMCPRTFAAEKSLKAHKSKAHGGLG